MTHTIDELLGATVILGRPGLAGTGITGGEKTTINNRLTALEAEKLGDHNDTTFTSLTDGQVVTWEASSSKWKNKAITQGLSSVRKNNAAVVSPASALDFADGFTIADAGSGRATVAPAFGTAAGTIRQGNQEANPQINEAFTIAATGVLSSGSRTLATRNFTLVNGVTYDIVAKLNVAARNNINNGTWFERVQIAGGTVASIEKAAVGGVPIEYEVTQVATVVGTGAAISVVASVAFSTGDPTDFRTGQLIVSASPRR